MSEWPDELVERVATALLNEDRRRYEMKPISLSGAHGRNIYRSQARAALDALGPEVVVLSAEEREALLWETRDEALALLEDNFADVLRRARAALEGKRGGDDE